MKKRRIVIYFGTKTMRILCTVDWTSSLSKLFLQTQTSRLKVRCALTLTLESTRTWYSGDQSKQIKPFHIQFTTILKSFLNVQKGDKEGSERRFTRRVWGGSNIVDASNFIVKWALEKGSILIWFFSVLQWNYMARLINIAALAYQNSQTKEYYIKIRYDKT